ncbi:MAG: hypothetical protein PHD04_03290 [Candidatus Pacebacteria bacterium]|nr:hypothetical protein [Candidatus Paceibacterota bacterium]
MDEILIGEKKYVSSKRAAQMTGYAKDYIGQLCREGRVPARLVGRSWYVLESAIQDHRFGDEKVEKKPREWESPRYEAAPIEAIPSVNRESNEGMTDDVAQNLQETWKAWFDRVADTPVAHESQEPVVEPEREETEPEPRDAEEVSVPVRAIYNQLPTELRPRHHAALSEAVEEEEEIVEEVRRTDAKRSYLVPVQMAGVLVAVIFAVLAVAGSGYFDKYIISTNQFGMTAGVLLYNR